jgi:hypothetical protein
LAIRSFSLPVAFENIKKLLKTLRLCALSAAQGGVLLQRAKRAVDNDQRLTGAAFWTLFV